MTERTDLESQKNETIENDRNNDSEIAVIEQIVEKTEENTQTVITTDAPDVNNESDWQKPISLKGFKKKLNELFVVK